MAMSVYKKRNGKWYCQFMVKGERVHKLLDGATDKDSAIALEVAEKFKLRQMQNGLLPRTEKKYQLSFMIEKYLKTNEHKDKAGAYAAQEYGELIIEKINGDFDNVMGLPMRLVKILLDTPIK
jgi:hypothetical protein